MNNFSLLQREQIWKKYFGNNLEGFDVFGRYVNIFSFECDHIYPKSRGGQTNIINGIPLSKKSNEEKSNNLRGIINGNYFEVKPQKENYGRLYINNHLLSKN